MANRWSGTNKLRSSSATPKMSNFSAPLTEAHNNLGLNIVANQGVHASSAQSGGTHSYSSEEVRAFASHINSVLGNDPDLENVLPLDPANHDIFFLAMQDGVLLCKLLNIVKPGLINPRHISFNPSIHHKTENLNTAIRACADLGIRSINISAEDFLSQTRHLMLSLIWQVIRQDLLKHINLNAHPEMITLMETGEDLTQFQALTPEATLLRWCNQQLGQAGHPRQMHNFSSDIADGENYLVLLHQIAPSIVPSECLRETNPQIRAQMVCEFAHKMGVDSFVTPKDISDGNRNLNLAFVADLFNKYPTIAVQQYDHIQHQALQQAELQSKLKLEEEEKLKQVRWAEEDAKRAAMWAAEDQARRQQFENEERSRREREAELSQKHQGEAARLAFEQQRLDDERRRLEEARIRNEQAQAGQSLAEQQRLENERRRLEEEKRRLEEATRARQEEQRRNEENSRRELEEQRRKLEEEKRAWEQSRNANTALAPPLGAYNTNQQPFLVPETTTYAPSQPPVPYSNQLTTDPYATQQPVPLSSQFAGTTYTNQFAVDPYATQQPAPLSSQFVGTTYTNQQSIPYSAPVCDPYQTYQPVGAPLAPPAYDPYATMAQPYGGYGYGPSMSTNMTTNMTTTGQPNHQNHVEINIAGKFKKKAMKKLVKNLPAITAQAQAQAQQQQQSGPPPGYAYPAAGYAGGGYPQPAYGYGPEGQPGYGGGQPPAYY